MQIGTWRSMSPSPSHVVFTGFSHLTLATDKLSWGAPRWHKSWIDWPFPETISFILCWSPLMGVLFVTFKVGKACSHLWPYSIFFLNLILTVRLWSSLIIIHGSSAGESSSWCVWQQCGGPLCMLLSCLSWGCHSLFVHPLATSLLGFHFRKNLLRSSSLCAQPVCSNST